jgi:hypothetical protein
MERLALNNLTEVVGEIYAPQGLLLANPADELKPLVDNYLQLLEKAGGEIVSDGRLSEETAKGLEQNLIPEDIYLQQINGFFDGFLSHLKHPYVKEW